MVLDFKYQGNDPHFWSILREDGCISNKIPERRVNGRYIAGSMRMMM